MGRKIFVFVALVLVAAVAVAGCKGREKEEQPAVRIGFFPNITHAQALLGFADGTFSKTFGSSGKVEKRVFNAGPAAMEALLAGELDIAYIGPVPAINGFVRSGGAAIVIAGAAEGGSVLVARREAKVTQVGDLRDKKVAVPQLGNTQDLLLRELLRRAGLRDRTKGGTVTVVPAENPDILTLLARGQVDAALVPEPWGSRLVKETGAEVVVDNKDLWRGGKYPVTVVVVRREFFQQHPQLVAKFLAAHRHLTQRLQQDPAGSAKQVNAMLKELTGKALPGDVMATSLKRITFTGEVDRRVLRELAELMKREGYLQGEGDISRLVAKVE